MLFFVLSAAAASPPPAWNWPKGELQRFHIETDIVSPKGIRYYAAENLDARAGEVKIRGDVGCTAKPEGKTQWLTCSFQFVEVTGIAWAPEEGEKLKSILAEWSENFKTTTVELEIAPDGRLKSLDMKAGRAQKNHREGLILDAQRALLQRYFCVFDLPITTDEKDWIRGWTQKASAVMQLQTSSGTSGAADIKHSHMGERYGLAVIETTGRGTLSKGSEVDTSGSGRLIDVRMAGETLFDTQRGMFIWRDYILDGRLVVSQQEAGSGAELYQVTALQWMPEYPMPGEAPLSVGATYATKLPGNPPALADGVALVPFADLGMQALYVQGHPEAAKKLQLPTTKVTARVQVSAGGVPTAATAFSGYQVLGPGTEQALMGAAFPKRDAAYAVDVEVEWRP